MAFLDAPINASDLPESNNDFGVLPPGDYTVRISEAGIKATKDGNGQYIKLTLDVTGPTHAGRKLFCNLNIRNASAKAEEIGRQQLGSLMRAIGLPTLKDTDQLIGGELAVTVKVKPADGQYGEQNEVKAYKAIGGGSAAPVPVAPAKAAPAASAPPWARK